VKIRATLTSIAYTISAHYFRHERLSPRTQRGEHACQIDLICMPQPMSAKDLMPAPKRDCALFSDQG
jgi:hypothetical protein